MPFKKDFEERSLPALQSLWDLVEKDIILNQIELKLLYIKGLVKGADLTEFVLSPLERYFQTHTGLPQNSDWLKLIPSASETKVFTAPEEATSAILAGWSILMAESFDFALGFFIPDWSVRQLTEPDSERMVRGPREGFTEDLQGNIVLVRRWIKDPQLRVTGMTIGLRTKTPVVTMYLEDLASRQLVTEVRRRLEAIEIDGVLESGYLEELITDRRLTIFPLIQSTERPDKVSAALLEGRVAILVDKSPFALIAPVTVNELYQTPEDYYLGYWLGTLLRGIRLLGNNLAVTLPGLYVALIGVNQELLPTRLLLTVAGLRAGIPFPIVIEVLLTSFAVEIFNETGLRLPGPLGGSIGVVVGVVLGFTAVQAGFISSPTLVIAVSSTIALYSGPNFSVSIAWRILKYFLIIGAALFGIYGLVIFGVLILAHAATLQSFGTSYLAPWAPLQLDALSDGPVRKPLWLRKKRPVTYRPEDLSRQGTTKQEGRNKKNE